MAMDYLIQGVEEPHAEDTIPWASPQYAQIFSLKNKGADLLRPFGVCLSTGCVYEHPVVLPHVSHFKHVPLRTKVKFPHSPHASPS